MKNKKNLKSRDGVSKTLVMLGVASSLFAFVIIGQLFFISKASIMSGYTVNGVKVGSSSSIDVANAITKHYNNEKKDYLLTLTHENNSWEFSEEDFVVSSNIHTVVEAAQKAQQQTTDHEKKVGFLNKLKNEGKPLQLAFNQIFCGLDEKINTIKTSIEKEALDSQVVFLPNTKKMFEFTESVDGIKVDTDALYEAINDNFQKNTTVAIKIPTYIVPATITKSDNEKLSKKIASFTTNVADSTGGRKANVKLALEKFNGMVVLSGEEISFNKVTGPHTKENGYKNATIIYNNRFVDGVGGGICQASTTLYNALLLAGVQINEVSKHSLPVKYVPLALDAMVAEGIADLKFTNTSSYPIFIKTSSTDKDVTVDIFSHELENNITYQTKSITIRQIPQSGDIIKIDEKGEYTNKVLFKGEFHRLTYPRDGFEAKAYLQKMQNNIMIEETEIRHEIYQPQNGIIIEGKEQPHEQLKPIDSGVKFIKAQHTSSGININEQNSLIPSSFSP